MKTLKARQLQSIRCYLDAIACVNYTLEFEAATGKSTIKTESNEKGFSFVIETLLKSKTFKIDLLPDQERHIMPNSIETSSYDEFLEFFEYGCTAKQIAERNHEFETDNITLFYAPGEIVMLFELPHINK